MLVFSCRTWNIKVGGIAVALGGISIMLILQAPLLGICGMYVGTHVIHHAATEVGGRGQTPLFSWRRPDG